jgi:predicted acylesterase/phospholipase RssA
MLTIHQATAQSSTDTNGTIGLAVAGGGPVGAIFELGALRAIDESISGLSLHELDVYVGVSAGALIAASLANGISTAEMCRIFIGDEYAEYSFEPERFLQPAYREYLQRVTRVPAILSESLSGILRHPFSANISQLVGDLSQAIPTGVFNNESLHDFIRNVFTSTGRSDEFQQLERQLYIVAVELDTGAAVRFGSPGNDNLPISRAVQASSALPGLYPPVEINGRYYVDGALRRTLHASVALDQGVELLIGINPLVPYDSSGAGAGSDPHPQVNRLIQGGLPMILSQTFRAMIQSRMEAGFAKYRSAYPQADLLLTEPNRGDEEMFFTNIFSYASRNTLCEHAYQCTRADLRERSGVLSAVLEKYGLSLHHDRLNDPDRTFADSLGAPQHAPVGRELNQALEQLEEAFNL